eukprot:5798559-Ditylum_brightwellii.AAC.1
MSTKGKVKTEGNNKSAGSMKRRRGGKKSLFYRKTKFTRKYEALRGSIFDVGEQANVDKYLTMLTEISTYVGRMFDYGGDISKTVLEVSLVNISMPGTRPADTDSVE